MWMQVCVGEGCKRPRWYLDESHRVTQCRFCGGDVVAAECLPTAEVVQLRDIKQRVRVMLDAVIFDEPCSDTTQKLLQLAALVGIPAVACRSCKGMCFSGEEACTQCWGSGMESAPVAVVNG